MSILHTVNKSPFEKNSLLSCLSHSKEGSAVLMIEDGVYGALSNSSVAKDVSQAMGSVTIYALAPDLTTRGIQHDKLIEGIELVDYDGFVDLAGKHDIVQSWL